MSTQQYRPERKLSYREQHGCCRLHLRNRSFVLLKRNQYEQVESYMASTVPSEREQREWETLHGGTVSIDMAYAAYVEDMPPEAIQLELEDEKTIDQWFESSD